MKISKRSKKIAKRKFRSQILKERNIFKEKLGMIDLLVHSELEEMRCPVSLEDYSFTNPPFQTNSCNHSISLDALRKLVIFENSNLRYMLCPLCRKHFHFASLNMNFFNFWFLFQILQNQLAMPKEEFINRLKKIPRYFTPKGGCLSVLVRA